MKILLLLWSLSCSTVQLNAPQDIFVNMIDPQMKPLGKIRLSQKGDTVVIQVDLKNISPGLHAMHFHENAVCEGPNFASAGGHFNPHKKQHGLKNIHGAHAGDLENIEASSDGSVHMTLTSTQVTLLPNQPHSLLSKTSIIIHQTADDHHTDPSGNSGNRIACGVIQP